MAAAGWQQRLGSALLYATSSFLIIFINKVVLTTYRFSDQALGLCQLVTTLICIVTAKHCGYVELPAISAEMARKIFPLPVLYFGNLMSGLGGTKRVSLPMLVTLRRFTLLITLILEERILRRKRVAAIKWSVYGMVVGSVIAGSTDGSFDLLGYVLILINDMTTSLSGIYVEKKTQSKELGPYGVLYYNCLFSLPPASLFVWWTGGAEEVAKFDSWSVLFVWQLMCSCFLGFVLLYSTMLCTMHNSALTTSVIGVIKNTSVTYLGMFVGGDYAFGMANFLGLNVSVFMSIIYSYVEIKQVRAHSTVQYNIQKEDLAIHPGMTGKQTLSNDFLSVPLQAVHTEVNRPAARPECYFHQQVRLSASNMIHHADLKSSQGKADKELRCDVEQP